MGVLALFGILFYCNLGFTFETTKKWLESATPFVTIVEIILYAVMGGGAMWYPLFFKLEPFLKTRLRGIKTQAEIAALKTKWIWHIAVMLGAGFHFKVVFDLVWVCHSGQ